MILLREDALFVNILCIVLCDTNKYYIRLLW